VLHIFYTLSLYEPGSMEILYNILTYSIYMLFSKNTLYMCTFCNNLSFCDNCTAFYYTVVSYVRAICYKIDYKYIDMKVEV